MKKLHSLFAVVSVGLVLLGAGCSSNSSTENTAGNTDTSSASTTITNSSKEVASDKTINIQNMAFAPSVLSVAVGDTVTFTNSDSLSHTATANDSSFDTGTIAPGESKTVTLREAKTITFHCNFHPSMTGTISVQ